jgi:DNA replication protein DnaC
MADAKDIETIARPCVDCGKPTEREAVPEGSFGASLLNNMPLRCAACAERQSKEAEAEEKARELEDRRRLFEQRVRSCGLPAAYHHWTLDKLGGEGQTEAVAAAWRFAAGELRGLALTGSYGTGKTTIAAATAKAYMWRTGRSLRWLKVHSIINDLGRGFGDPIRDATLNALTGHCALVLDDLDKTKPTEHAVGPLFTAVDECVSESRPLIVTTNLSLSEIAAKWADSYGEAIASRLAGYCDTYTVGGHDRRLAA